MKSVPGPTRPLPLLTELNTFFWTGGADGKLRMQRCLDCQYWQHPAGAICPQCLSRNLAPQELSGRATVEAFTLNYQPWTDGVEVPYVIAIVGLDEQKGLNLTTNIVGIAPESVFIGQRVEVTFEAAGDVFLPLFTPAPELGTKPV
ncbi:Zn-ribbon domain-containing OB-fold protein [Herbaspirillum autotrophicum]|uniref:Zn-ribbon domain-containing OB-fold protein n=1 Tax=Herbaspirillum autotrophicum TaxID=180195 RepID=UPI00067CA259|nr:OB-fold domain-containing protein [Herbaspirillum autotrophicum]